MMRRIFYFTIFLALCMMHGVLTSCSDDEQFTTSRSDMLTLPEDTLKMDTIFSGISSATYTFWIHNKNTKALRVSDIRMADGSKGFRINVDGEYLNQSIRDLEVLGEDSLLVFVEMTPQQTGKLEPEPIDEQLVFTLESGAEQRVKLRAWAWDAERWENKTVKADETIVTEKPILVYGALTVAEGATLRLKGATLYFHADAPLVVEGALEAEGVTMRGDRLDDMFWYLPYDRVGGQWRGVRVKEKARVTMTDCDIHAAYACMTVDAGAVLQLTRTIVHNNDGTGIYASEAEVMLDHCQLSNASGSLLSAQKSHVTLLNCTLAQYYPFAMREVALNLGEGTTYVIEKMLIGAYEEELIAVGDGVEQVPEEAYRVAKKDDFVLIDEENFIYDFHLKPDSEAAGYGCY